MLFFQDPTLSKTLFEHIEAGQLDQALLLLVSYKENLFNHTPPPKDNAQFFLKAYQKSKNQTQWLEFWEKLLNHDTPLFEPYIIPILNISQTRTLPFPAFLFSALKFPKHIHLFEMPVMGLFVRRYKDPSYAQYLKRLIELVLTEDETVKNNFYQSLARCSLKHANEELLNFLENLKGSLYLAQCLELLNADSLFDAANILVLKNIQPELIIRILENLHHFEKKMLFSAELILKIFQNHCTYFIEKLIQKHESIGLIEILQNFSPPQRTKLIHFMVSNHPSHMSFMVTIINKLRSPEFYDELLRESFNQFNISLFKSLARLEPPHQFLKVIQTLESIKLETFITLEAHQADFITLKMTPFIKGFGHITYPDVLLSLAQRRARKTYDFQALVLAEEEIDEFFKIVKIAKKPISKIFIISGCHFSCGILNIDDKNHARIFLIDSLGFENIHHHKKTLGAFIKNFPKHEIFFSKELRQKSSMGCSLFALDDVAHLNNLHIEEHKNIWDYLSFEKKPENEYRLDVYHQDIMVYNAALPLSLTRTMQSTTLLKQVIPQKPPNIQNFPINKKKQTTAQSAISFFHPSASEDNKLINKRLDYKLNKMIHQNWQFLIKNSEHEVNNAMQDFTFNAFKISETKS